MNNAPDSQPAFIYKIVPESLWLRAKAEGIVPPMPIDEADGYMHFSTAQQLRETLSLHFRGQGSLTVLTVPLANVEKDIRWETSRGGQLFPHLFAPLPVEAVSADHSASVDEDGVVSMQELL